MSYAVVPELTLTSPPTDYGSLSTGSDYAIACQPGAPLYLQVAAPAAAPAPAPAPPRLARLRLASASPPLNEESLISCARQHFISSKGFKLLFLAI